MPCDDECARKDRLAVTYVGDSLDNAEVAELEIVGEISFGEELVVTDLEVSKLGVERRDAVELVAGCETAGACVVVRALPCESVVDRTVVLPVCEFWEVQRSGDGDDVDGVRVCGGRCESDGRDGA